MAAPRSKITAQGQVSVPAEIRRKLDVGPGSTLEWMEEGDRVFVKRAGLYTWEDIRRAVFPTPPRRRTDAELKEGIAEYMRKKYPRR